jgi:hypothetical protein
LHRILVFFLISLQLPAFGQINLLPSIGVGSLPSDSDSVCYIPWYLGSFYNSGLQAGDTAYDFKLYNLNNDSLVLEEALSQSRPVLLVAGSYTCPVFRNMIPAINDVVSNYAGLLDVYVIYTLEAHPNIDTSVYFGHVQTGTPNIQAGILYRQPSTYEQRKTVVADMLDSLAIAAPVFIDGPCNNWWNTYGPAPNNAYLIDTNGVVFSKHGWFNRYPDNIFCSIDSLLGTSSGNCAGTGMSNYTFQMISSDTVYDAAGVTISVDAELTNTGTQDILVYARKLENHMPPGWESSMCIDVCYASNIDSAVFILPAGITQPVHVYFYTVSASIDTGHVKMGFKNLSDTTNKNFMHAFGITTLPTSIATHEPQHSTYSISPNPASSVIKINGVLHSQSTVQIFNIPGKLLIESNRNEIDISGLSAGIYMVRINDSVVKFIKE